jgi:hypothetical protein
MMPATRLGQAGTHRSFWKRHTAGRIITVIIAVLAATLTMVVVAQPPAYAEWNQRDRFSREVVRPGARDTDPYHIAHVYELQYRLRWLGLLDVMPTGYYGDLTKAAVIAFQEEVGVKGTGVVGYRTWRPLIRKTVRGRDAVPGSCKKAGWHACYDRSQHQVNLYHRGRLLNSWLVRGGGSDTPTRTGKFVVYWRDIDHVSSLYDAPMPYAQFFSGGQALHGSRLMVDPFVGHSHGCVNFWVEDARQLWNLTHNTKLRVHVYGAWS